jgi:hypothetical protein
MFASQSMLSVIRHGTTACFHLVVRDELQYSIHINICRKMNINATETELCAVPFIFEKFAG